jgi:hypothetical protein
MTIFLPFLSLVLIFASTLWPANAQFGGEGLPECDLEQAERCEYEYLQCRLFTGPANDAATMCRCGETFFGDCLRRAGCAFGRELDRLSAHEIYSKICVDHIMKYDCPSTLMCSLNCATETFINTSISKVIPFNNYGRYHLRVRICDRVVHPEYLERYANVIPVPCKELSDFKICHRWIPPLTFIPVAIPSNTTYIEVDSCEFLPNGKPLCHVTTEPMPTRVYGNQFIFASQFNVAQTNVSVCEKDGECYQSF